MTISVPFVRRPVATILLALALALFGFLAFELLPVAPLPEIDFPTINVLAHLPGADPATVASSVATPLERQFGHIAGVTQMTSISSRGVAQVTLQFDLQRNIDGAARDVQAAINAARANLPSNLDGSPTYRKVNPSNSPIMVLSLTSDSASSAQLYDAAATVLQQQLLRTPGVGDVVVGGGALPAVRVELNPDRMSHYGVSLEQVRSTIANTNVNLPKGSINTASQHYSIGANDMLSQPAEYQDLIVKQQDSHVVRIADIGYAIDDVESLANDGLANGKQAVLLVIYKQPGANIIKTVDTIKADLPFLQASIRKTINLDVLLDRTTTIRASLLDVEITLLVSVLLVTIVTFIFFKNWRATLIPAIVVPLSLLGTFGVMYFLGFSLNTLSLMAMTISTGFVVDDAIVVVENILRHLERGKTPFEAAIDGASEVGFTVLTISVSLVAVFIPLLMMGGLVGRLLREFSVSLSVSIIISMLVSLTVSPMLSRLLLRPEASESIAKPSRVLQLYTASLAWVLRHPVLMGVVTVLVFVLNIVLFIVIPKGLFPQEDTGFLIGTVQAAQNISFQEMQREFLQINQIVKKNPDVATVGGIVGGVSGLNNALLFITLKPLEQRHHNADAVIAALRKTFDQVPGARLYLQAVQDLSAGGRIGGAQYQYTLTADRQEDLEKFVPQVVAAMHQLPLLTDINIDQQNNSAKVNINVHRELATRLGIGIDTIDQTLHDAFGERLVSTLYRPANQYHVVMELAPGYSASPQALDAIHIPAGNTGNTGSTGQSSATSMVPLSAIATFTNTRAPITISHQGTFPAVTISFNLRPGAAIGQATQQINQVVTQLRLPANIVGQFAGTAQAFQQSLSSEPVLIIAALLAVYIVLGILYESLLHPLTILSTLPSAGLGALIALLATHTELSVIAVIGMLLLIGIVKKNAIMMIDFALVEQRQHQRAPADAIFHACLNRFRPIMMTTIAAILGALPLIIGTGYGAEFRKPLGIAIIGGLLVSQVLTLYTTPVIYLWIDRFRKKSNVNEKPA